MPNGAYVESGLQWAKNKSYTANRRFKTVRTVHAHAADLPVSQIIDKTRFYAAKRCKNTKSNVAPARKGARGRLP